MDFSVSQGSGNINYNTLVNTKCYSAPETLLKCRFVEAVDMWTLGLTLVDAALETDFIPYNTYDILRVIINMRGQTPYHV